MVGAGNNTALPASVFKGSARRRSSATIRLPTGKVADSNTFSDNTRNWRVSRFSTAAMTAGSVRNISQNRSGDIVGHGAARHGLDGGGARLAVDGGELAEHFAGY